MLEPVPAVGIPSRSFALSWAEERAPSRAVVGRSAVASRTAVSALSRS
ncbi:MAG TPA: hypothetical protein VF168_12040 [Trueperaceae bacterium]